jgi:hypothetical protein
MASSIIQPTMAAAGAAGAAGAAPLTAGNASMLAVATMGLSGNKYVLGLMILLINLGARYIGNEVGEFMHKVLNHKFARRFLIFLVLWMGTRDLVVAGVITISFIILVNTLFNENSAYCILPVTNNSPITREEYDLAKQVISKYEIANPQQTIPNSNMNSNPNNMSGNSNSLPINNNNIVR